MRNATANEKFNKLTRAEKGRLTTLLFESATVTEDKITFHQDGTVTVKDSYFYRPKRSVETWVQKVLSGLPDVKIVDSDDKWQDWPKMSYYFVRFRPGTIPQETK